MPQSIRKIGSWQKLIMFFAGKWASDNLKLVEGYSARRSVAKVLFRSEVNDFHGEKVLAK